MPRAIVRAPGHDRSRSLGWLAVAWMEYFVVRMTEAAGQGGWKAWAYSISVDVPMFSAWGRMQSEDAAQRKGAWFCFGLARTASLAANIGTAGVLDLASLPTALRVVLGAWPAVAFLGGTLLFHARKTHAEESP